MAFNIRFSARENVYPQAEPQLTLKAKGRATACVSNDLGTLEYDLGAHSDLASRTLPQVSLHCPNPASCVILIQAVHYQLYLIMLCMKVKPNMKTCIKLLTSTSYNYYMEVGNLYR